MKIAILGTDADVVRLATAAVGEGHEIIWLGDVRPEEVSAIQQLASRRDGASQWELLLDGSIADAVIVGRGTASGDVRAEQLKRLAAEGVPLLVVHPVTPSVLTYYEVDMIRRETHGIVRHYNPVASHPVVADLAAWVRDGHPTIGQIHQVTCERRLADTGRPNVLRHLARDVELMATTAGDIRRVSAIGPATADASHASLQVQMTTDGPASLRWSVGSPSHRASALEMTLVGERGSLTLRAPDDAPSGDECEWQLETTGEEANECEPLPDYDAPLAAIEQFAAAVAEKDIAHRAAASTWDKATRAMEVVDAVELSLQKGRMIDVYQQQLTERLAFRGTMAAVGCGLLLISFVVLVAVTILGGAERPGGNRLAPSWGFALLALLGFFLLLQALPLLAAKLSRKRAASADDRPNN